MNTVWVERGHRKALSQHKVKLSLRAEQIPCYQSNKEISWSIEQSDGSDLTMTRHEDQHSVLILHRWTFYLTEWSEEAEDWVDTYKGHRPPKGVTIPDLYIPTGGNNLWYVFKGRTF
jgi:hypothetical protein